MQITFLWFLLFVNYGSSDLLEYYEAMTNDASLSRDRNLNLPHEVTADKSSGCLCRATETYRVIVCFGNYACSSFPKINKRSAVLRVRTSVIVKLLKGEIDKYYYLSALDIEANHQLKYIEPGTFRNLSRLQHLSISYNTALQAIEEKTFEGLIRLRNLTLVNNGFNNVLQLTPALRPTVLPQLKSLDISENSFETIPEEAFQPMRGSVLNRLDINLCRLDYVHRLSFLPLRHLNELFIGENDLNSSMIAGFLLVMNSHDINLRHLDLSGMGFRKQPPRNLLDAIANTTVRMLSLAQNQFEVINDDTFPQMPHVELLDLRKVLVISIGPNAFDPIKFPNLKVLLLSSNNLPGIHQTHLSNQLLLLDISYNLGSPLTPVYFEISRDTFIQSTELRVLNLSYNRIKAVCNYSFTGLSKLKILNMENDTLYHIDPGTFRSMNRLEMLNLANNPLTANENLTSAQFVGLRELRVLIMINCGIRRLYDEDNIFSEMPNITHLILRNNQLYYITAETLKPLKRLQVLDLSENLMISWWKPLFLHSGVHPHHLYLRNNKISHFSKSMIQDINYLLGSGNSSVEIDLMDNVFVCDCNAMFTTYLWLEVNGTRALKRYFAYSRFQCSSPDVWEDRRVAEYLSSVKSLNCIMIEKISNVMVLVWTIPSLITISFILLIIGLVYKYRVYIRYWMFLAKVALGRRLIRKSLKDVTVHKGYTYDGFVSYCYEDRDFVMEMLTQLEMSPPYLKLCVSERDFEIGSYISESILTSINESKYVILVISNNFAKSHWCRWETQLAEYHRIFLEDGVTYDPLILVRIGDVESKYLTPTLKYLLKTKIYLPWNDDKPEEFWKKLRNVLLKN